MTTIEDRSARLSDQPVPVSCCVDLIHPKTSGVTRPGASRPPANIPPDGIRAQQLPTGRNRAAQCLSTFV